MGGGVTGQDVDFEAEGVNTAVVAGLLKLALRAPLFDRETTQTIVNATQYLPEDTGVFHGVAQLRAARWLLLLA